MHPLDWLMERTQDADPRHRGVTHGKIYQVLNREREFTVLAVADALLVAMGAMEALYDGTVEVLENPFRPGCCGMYRPSAVAVLLAE